MKDKLLALIGNPWVLFFVSVALYSASYKFESPICFIWAFGFTVAAAFRGFGRKEGTGDIYNKRW